MKVNWKVIFLPLSSLIAFCKFIFPINDDSEITFYGMIDSHLIFHSSKKLLNFQIYSLLWWQFWGQSTENFATSRKFLITKKPPTHVKRNMSIHNLILIGLFIFVLCHEGSKRKREKWELKIKFHLLLRFFHSRASFNFLQKGKTLLNETKNNTTETWFFLS